VEPRVSRAHTAPGRGSDLGPNLDPAALVGPIGEFVLETAPFTEADPAALLASVLVAFGAAVGSRPHLLAGNAPQRAALFVLVSAENATANRGLSWSATRPLLQAMDPLLARERIRTGFGTGREILQALSRPLGPRRPQEAGPQPTGQGDERLLVFEPGMAQAIQTARRPSTPLAWVVRNAWDGLPLELGGARHRVVIERHHVGVIAHATASQLGQLLSETGAGAPFLSRFLFVVARRQRPLPDEGNIPPELFWRYGVRLRAAADRARDQGLLTRTPDAEAVWAELSSELRQPGADGLFGLALARSLRQAIRLQLVYALSEGATEIARRHVVAAVAFWRFCRQSAETLFAAPGDLADRLWQLLVAAGPDGLTLTEQSAAFHRNVRAADLAAARHQLEQAGLVTTVQETPSSAGGRRRAVTRITTEPDPDPSRR